MGFGLMLLFSALAVINILGCFYLQCRLSDNYKVDRTDLHFLGLLVFFGLIPVANIVLSILFGIALIVLGLSLILKKLNKSPARSLADRINKHLDRVRS